MSPGCCTRKAVVDTWDFLELVRLAALRAVQFDRPRSRTRPPLHSVQRIWCAFSPKELFVYCSHDGNVVMRRTTPVSRCLSVAMMVMTEVGRRRSPTCCACCWLLQARMRDRDERHLQLSKRTPPGSGLQNRRAEQRLFEGRGQHCGHTTGQLAASFRNKPFSTSYRSLFVLIRTRRKAIWLERTISASSVRDVVAAEVNLSNHRPRPYLLVFAMLPFARCECFQKVSYEGLRPRGTSKGKYFLVLVDIVRDPRAGLARVD